MVAWADEDRSIITGSGIRGNGGDGVLCSAPHQLNPGVFLAMCAALAWLCLRRQLPLDFGPFA